MFPRTRWFGITHDDEFVLLVHLLLSATPGFALRYTPTPAASPQGLRSPAVLQPQKLEDHSPRAFGTISEHRSRTPTVRVPRAGSKEVLAAGLVHSHTDGRIRLSEHDRFPAVKTGSVKSCDGRAQ